MTEVLATLAPGSLRQSASHTSFFNAPRRRSSSHADLASLAAATASASSTSSNTTTNSRSATNLSFRAKFGDDGSDASEEDDSSDDEGHLFPAYLPGTRRSKLIEAAREVPPSSPVSVSHPSSPPTGPAATDSPAAAPDAIPHSEDDTAVRVEPSHHVDYLSYEWKEEDIWSSWRHIVERRKVYGERSRLENASWRTWAKAQFQLKTVSPETLNWYVRLGQWPALTLTLR